MKRDNETIKVPKCTNKYFFKARGKHHVYEFQKDDVGYEYQPPNVSFVKMSCYIRMGILGSVLSFATSVDVSLRTNLYTHACHTVQFVF